MKKGKMFKKSISCLLAALMIIASMPFSAISASAANGTLSANSYQIVRGGSNTRWENNQFNIVNDQEADNTSIGIIKYDISSLQGMVINSASLNFTIDNFHDDSQGLVFYYSNRLTNVTLNNGSTQDTLSKYGAGTVANESAASRYGFSTNNVLAYGSVNASAQTSDVKTQLQTIVDSGAKSFYVFVMQKTAGGLKDARLDGKSTDDGWTDTNIKPANITISVNYDVDNRPVTLDQAKAKLNRFNYTSIETKMGKWYDSSSKVLSMPSGTYSNLLYAGDSNADNGSFTGSGTGTVGKLRYQQSVFLYDGQNTPTAPIMVVYGYTGTGRRYVGAITLSDNRNNSLKLVDYWKCSRAGSYGNNWDYPNVWAQNGNDDINPSYDYSNPSTTGAQIAEDNTIFNRWSVAPGMANKMQYDGKMSDTTYSQDIQLTVDFYQGGSSNNTLSIHDTITGNKKCYVVNYKVVLDKIKQAKIDINTVKDEYSERTKSAYAKALSDLLSFDPATLSFSDSTLDNDVATAGAKIKTLIDNYDNAYKNLSIDYTFKKVDGSTTTVPAKNADEAYKHKPANTFDDCEKLSNTQHTKYTYTWPTNPSGYVFTEKKEEVTENHNFTTTATCTCGAKVDDASFEAAKKEAAGILTQSSLYENTSFTNFMNTVSTLGSKRSNGELLCQDDFDRATCEILYAKTLLKKNQGTVTLTVYDQNNQVITDETKSYNVDYGTEITIAPKTVQNVYKYVIEKDGATSEIYGQSSIGYVVTGDASVMAYCNNAQTADEKYTKVTFLVGGRISDIKYVKAGETLDTSDANKLQFPFFTTGKWDTESVVGSDNVSSVTVNAELKPVDSDKCGVHIPGIVDPYQMAYDTRVDVKDYGLDDGVDYALSKSPSKDDIIAYMHGTVFYVPARKDVYVLKVTKGESTKQPKVNTVGTFTSVDDKNKYVGFNCKFSLPADCTPVEWGITFIPMNADYRPVDANGNPTSSTVFRIKTHSKENEYAATLSLSKTSTKYSAIKAKAYLKYKDSDNNIQVIYGDEYVQAFGTTNKFGITQ